MLVDSHCHLDFPDFADELDQVVARAGEAGIGLMLTICTRISEFDRVLAITERFDNVYCSLGIHPHNVETEIEVSRDQLIDLAQHPKVVGIGETGLDYYYEHSPRELQKKSLRSHIAAARETGLPLIVHTRDADRDMAEILREEIGHGAFPGLLHCFSSSDELARTALDLGFYISLSGILTFTNAKELQATAKTLPQDKILVETDAPYLAPVPKRGKRNEPAFVAHTAKFLSELRAVPIADIHDQTTDNFFRLFTKIPRTERGPP